MSGSRADNPLHTAVIAHLASRGLDVDDDPRTGTATFHIDHAGGMVRVRCTSSSDGVLVVRAEYPHPIALVDVIAVHELVSRANATIGAGCLDIDLDTGDVQFRSAIDFAGTPTVDGLVARTIEIAVDGMVHWMPSIALAANGLPIDLALAAAGAA